MLPGSGRLQLIGPDQAFNEERPVRQDIAGSFRDQHVLQVHPVIAFGVEVHRLRQNEGDASRPARGGVQGNEIAERLSKHLLAKGQHLALMLPGQLRVFDPRRGLRINQAGGMV
ncbi:hypothetical protein D3C75_1020320 [compost metagenome]